MKLKKHDKIRTRGQNVIAQFGQAALVRQSDGICQLKGGSEDDRHLAREWISLFMHEAILNCR